jgi:hypothetical protein
MVGKSAKRAKAQVEGLVTRREPVDRWRQLYRVFAVGARSRVVESRTLGRWSWSSALARSLGRGLLAWLVGESGSELLVLLVLLANFSFSSFLGQLVRLPSVV